MEIGGPPGSNLHGEVAPLLGFCSNSHRSEGGERHTCASASPFTQPGCGRWRLPHLAGRGTPVVYIGADPRGETFIY